MSLLTKEVEVGISGSNTKYYENKGYIIPKREDKRGRISILKGTKIRVKIKDLSKSSHALVDIKCDKCGKTLEKIEWCVYTKCVHEDEKYYCKKCAINLYGSERMRKSRLKNSNNSFVMWLFKNLKLKEITNILSRWDYKLNKCNPNEISCTSEGLNRKGYWFKCPKGLHPSELKSIAGFVRRQNNELKSNGLDCNMCNSFKQWCTEHNRQDILDRWDYKLNGCSPEDITYGTTKKYWFKCPKGIHPSELKNIHGFVGGQEGSMNCKMCDSFAQYGYDNISNDFLSKYWDWEKNDELGIDPWMISYGSKIKIWIRCQEKSYHESYEIQCKSFTINECRCPYCSGHKVHRFDSLGWLYPQVFDIWSDKNKKSPYEYTPFSQQKVWWKCLDGKHKDYYKIIGESNFCKFRCPECVQERSESILQEKTRLYLESLGYNVLHENKCTLIPINPKTNNQLPFDNEIKLINSKHLICEVHGKQHYEITGFYYVSARENNTTKEYELHYQKLKDRYKKLIAYKNRYGYLEIPYWTDDKDETYKTLIDNKINEILNINNITNEKAS